ncbi:MAG: hypothetical protein QW331_02065 [Candidatus Woesearchaeota archaeon]
MKTAIYNVEGNRYALQTENFTSENGEVRSRTILKINGKRHETLWEGPVQIGVNAFKRIRRAFDSSSIADVKKGFNLVAHVKYVLNQNQELAKLEKGHRRAVAISRGPPLLEEIYAGYDGIAAKVSAPYVERAPVFERDLIAELRERNWETPRIGFYATPAVEFNRYSKK